MIYFVSIWLCLVCVWGVRSCPVDPSCTCGVKYVYCHGASNLGTIPAHLPSNITDITLKHYGIITIETNKLQHLYNLTRLIIEYNNIQTIQTGAFDSLQMLSELSLAYNNISVLQPRIFSKLHKLKKLKLSGNKLVTLEYVLDGLVSLDRLYVRSNDIQAITASTFTGLTNLRVLYLGDNNISSIDNQSFSQLKYLAELSVSRNPLYKFYIDMSYNNMLFKLDFMLCRLTHFPPYLPNYVHSLSLNRNNITAIYKADTARLHTLKALLLDYNQLTMIEHGAFSHMTVLKFVDLKNNNLQTVPGPFDSSRLESLFLERNAINTILPESFQPGTKLISLSLQQNNITRIPSDTFKNVEFMNHLMLDANPFSELTDNMFFNDTIIYVLSLKYLNLETIHRDCFNGLSTLTTLDMSHVNITLTNIQGNIFRNMVNLQRLDINNSPGLAAYILSNTEVLQSLSTLTDINLMETGLTQLSSQFVELLPNLKVISISGNPFICHPDLLWLHTFMQIHMDKFRNPFHISCLEHNPTNGSRYMNLLTKHYYDIGAHNITDYDYYDYNIDYDPHHNFSDPYDHYNGSLGDLEDYLHHYFYGDDDQSVSNDTSQQHIHVTETSTSTTAGRVVSTETSDSTTDKQQDTTPPIQTSSNSQRAIGIAIGMAFAVIVTMLFVAMIIYFCFRFCKRQTLSASHEYQGKEDYVFILSKTDIQNDTNSVPIMTREQRGSTTSRASEDITNQTDRSLMGVFTLDVDT